LHLVRVQHPSLVALASSVREVSLIWKKKWRVLLFFVVFLGGYFAIRSLYSIFGNNDLTAEIERVRQLARSGDTTKLAETLDRSTVRILAGEFVMGSNTGRSDERPQRSVYLDAFEIDRFEVSNAQYQRFLQATQRIPPVYWSGTEYPTGQADYPVVGVSWDEADAYCIWIGKRLPTEAEWEKACRSSDGRLYPWGNTWDAPRANVEVSGPSAWPLEWNQAWMLLKSASSDAHGRQLQPIGSYPEGASPDGVLDMVGNASEWIWDWYNWSDYKDLPTQNPRSLGPPWNHSLRGSPWFDPYGGTSWTQAMSRCSARNSSHETQDPRVGFRCAKSVSP
jgi:sulfatase modifying factor 1